MNILRLPDVEKKTGYKRSSIYEKMAKGEFPAAIKLGPRAIGWLEKSIETWIEERIAESDSRAAS